jgi:hypothetical protein
MFSVHQQRAASLNGNSTVTTLLSITAILAASLQPPGEYSFSLLSFTMALGSPAMLANHNNPTETQRHREPFFHRALQHTAWYAATTQQPVYVVCNNE